MTPRVSVLLPYRDVGGLVEEALQSILDQRDVDLEVLAIDDGSRDDGPGRVARIAARPAVVLAMEAEGILKK